MLHIIMNVIIYIVHNILVYYSILVKTVPSGSSFASDSFVHFTISS